MREKLTSWFDFNTPPVHRGFYEVSFLINLMGTKIRIVIGNRFYWNGKEFLGIDRPLRIRHYWRGLERKP